MAMTILEPRCLSADIASVLENEILSGVMAPGTRIDEQTLASRFGVSRTPVRDALRQLEASGLIDLRPRQGAFVAELTLGKLLELFEIMSSLEGLCARLAARRASAEEVAAIQHIQDDLVRLVEVGDADAYYTRNRDFHERIYAASANGTLEEMTRSIRNRVGPYRRHQLRRLGRLKASAAEHQAVLDAIAAGDPERAEFLMRDHISVQGDALADIISALPERIRRAAS
jgi:DNA-binding GntR family transcriptional regulator